ncbi:MAG TPA: GtrA family protein [Nocardioidaceae bacterium]|nr:GtrA family protein [Nocardioidaceae bacterium]
MGRRMQRLAAEGAKFLAVGGMATLVAFLLFNLLVHGIPGGDPGVMNGQPLSAYVIANLVGMVVSYRGSRSWAFRHREPVGAAGGRVSYFVINTVTMAIPLLCLAFSRYVLGLDSALADNIAANVVGLALGTAARFWAFRRFVFLSARRLRRRELAS